MRLRFFVLASMLLMILAAWGALAPAYAAERQTAPMIHHDRSHPIYVGDIGAPTHAQRYLPTARPTGTQAASSGQPAAIGPVPVIPVSSPRGQGVQPADWQPQYRVCTNGVAHAQPEIHLGKVYYWLPLQTNTTLQYLVYFWCPSPYDAGGYNFSYTLASFTNGANLTTTTGQTCDVNNRPSCQVRGAGLQRADGVVFGNNEPVETFAVTPGEYVFDYSPPEDGHAAYRGLNGLYGFDGTRFIYNVYEDPAYI